MILRCCIKPLPLSTRKMASAKGEIQDRTVNVNFFCQRCCQPLKMDPSFISLDEHMFTDLTGTLITNSRSSIQVLGSSYQEDDGEDISRKVVPPVRLTESGNGFMWVGDSNDYPASHKLWVTSRLFDILSDQSDIDQPLCEECTDALLDQMDAQLRIAEDESNDYREFLDQLERQTEEEDLDSLKDTLQKLHEEEQELQVQLKQVEEEHRVVREEEERCLAELTSLTQQQEALWRDYAQLQQQLLLCEDEQRSVDNQLRTAQTQLEKLKKTNVFNATFHIWHSGQFGTINNFRLGRLPHVPVDWTEINAAWGQTVLLLDSLAKKMNLIFQRYRLVPYGNHSFIECLQDKSKELPLHGSGGFKFFWDTKFDQAMVAFLDCLQQFKEEVEKGDSQFCLPYKMDHGRIEDPNRGHSYSIKIQFNSEEQWTKALKFMLTNLKWGLAWVASQFANK